MIAPLSDSDIDVFVVLDSKYYYHYDGKNGGQAGLLDLLKRALKVTYPQTPDISRNGQAVTIRFSDFIVDVVPCFSRTDNSYLIANSITQSWIPTNPRTHVEIVKSLNQRQNGMFVPTVKMIKAWNKSHGKFFNSFHLEVLAILIFNNITISDFPSGVRYFFDQARYHVKQKNPDPAGFDYDVGSYLNTHQKLDEATRKLQRAFEASIGAEDYERRGMTKEAITTWQHVFGDYFPSYG